LYDIFECFDDFYVFGRVFEYGLKKIFTIAQEIFMKGFYLNEQTHFEYLKDMMKNKLNKIFSNKSNIYLIL
jgi:hypothetical protein